MSARSDKNRIIIFDTTMRDGEQSPGASMNLDEKLRIAETLEDMGVDVIEAGFPIASDGDFEAVNEIAKVARKSTICGLARATKIDIDRAAQALKPAKRSRIHTFIATSELHMKHKLQLEAEEVYAKVIESVTHARKFTDDVEWWAEGAWRNDASEDGAIEPVGITTVAPWSNASRASRRVISANSSFIRILPQPHCATHASFGP